MSDEETITKGVWFILVFVLSYVVINFMYPTPIMDPDPLTPVEMPWYTPYKELYKNLVFFSFLFYLFIVIDKLVRITGGYRELVRDLL